MKKFYHADVTGSLKEDMHIKLGNGSLSKFGQIYQARFRRLGINEFCSKPLPDKVALLDDSSYREYFLELFRIEHPHLKELDLVSRLNCFFAVESVENAYEYANRHGHKTKPTIYEVHTDGPIMKLDMTWLDHQFTREFSAFEYYYRHYWLGKKIEEDQHLSAHEKRGSFIEVLISGDVYIGSRVE
ncbi:hypothetical protein [Vibrio aquimaris]|uniref:DUF2441 domain-containing protein n=2 Tax=Vibrio TaxID=662 RepID=A0A5P9CL92_9VIBR|nr:hypothetical protein [Vibrio aquimaris]QFT26322.1 hypothetical protein FIV01_07770 [Vibrio aquimaris]